MEPDELTLEAFTEGDAFPGLSLQIVVAPEDVDGSSASDDSSTESGSSEELSYAPPAFPLVSAKMVFKKANIPAIELSSAHVGQITIVHAVNWELAIPQQVIPELTEGIWRWAIKTVDSRGMPETYVVGSLTVLPYV